jgi:hypothetical protein
MAASTPRCAIGWAATVGGADVPDGPGVSVAPVDDEHAASIAAVSARMPTRARQIPVLVISVSYYFAGTLAAIWCAMFFAASPGSALHTSTSITTL